MQISLKKFVKDEKRCWHISFILSHDKLSRNLFNSIFVLKIVQNIPEYQNHDMSQMSLDITQGIIVEMCLMIHYTNTEIARLLLLKLIWNIPILTLDNL